MADVRIEMAPEGDIRAFLAGAVRPLFDDRLGPDITADAVRACPVLTGRLSASLDHEVIGEPEEMPTLIVGSFPDEEGPVKYAAAVELGFHGMEAVRAYETKAGRHVRAHMRRGNSPEQPYLRPALYRKRSA